MVGIIEFIRNNMFLNLLIKAFGIILFFFVVKSVIDIYFFIRIKKNFPKNRFGDFSLTGKFFRMRENSFRRIFRTENPIDFLVFGNDHTLKGVVFNVPDIRRLSKIKSKYERRLRTTRIEFLRRIISAVIYVLAIISILFLITGFKTLSISLLAGAGILAIVIGFAAQKTLANIVRNFNCFIHPF